ncbi:MAG: right-handed parallel beta-helix repeat-containing protein [Verrucomicrobiota bacterium JB022]|nr:right-handed parallel beta-helix repeat-containing protein [Verrucomicrobiota bacterium JB022]
MTTSPTRFFSLAALLGCLVTPLAAQPHEIWVSPDGDDAQAGTQDAPLATIERAQRQARDLRRLKDPAIAEGIRIVIRGGTYRLDQPMLVRWEDSGTAESPTVFAAAEGERPVISGGVSLEGWQQQANSPLWVADAPLVGDRPLQFRNLWINGERGQRAREADGEDLHRVLAWDKENEVGVIEASAVEGLGEPAGLEFVIHQMWAIAILRVKSIEIDGDEARLQFHQPEHQVQFEHPWPPVVINEEYGNSAYYLANRLEFVDEPGEWYQDPKSGKVYYYPRAGETPAKAEVIAPVLETLVEVAGAPGWPVEHVEFEGLQFSHTTWMRPSEFGYVPLQAGFYMYEAYKLKQPGTEDKAGLENQAWVGRKPGAVELRYTQGTAFRGCFFEHLASSGLDYVIGAKHDTVEGNVFRDIGGNGFVVGPFQEEGVETHIPYNRAPEVDHCVGTRFVNNLVNDVAHDDWGCVGVAAGYVSEIEIAHNEISDVAYSGISLGWGWTRTETVMRDNRVQNNHIHHFGKAMYDTGGIYTLSNQPNTVISGNAVHTIYRPPFVHDPYHWSYIYLDEGSANITIENNWAEGIKFSTNANGPGNVWRNNGPDVSDEVRENAGLQGEYRSLLQFATVK